MVAVFVLVFLSLQTSCETACTGVEYIKDTRNSSFNIVGIVPLRKSSETHQITAYGVYTSIALRFAIWEANQKILPRHFQLGYFILDDCGEATEYILNEIFINMTLKEGKCDCNVKDDKIGVIGPYSSAGCKHLSTISSSTKLPIVSYQATSIELNNKELYPRFLRTIPPDDIQAKVISEFARSYNWTYISLVSADNSYGWFGRLALLHEFKKNGICTDLDIRFKVPYDFNEIETVMMLVKNIRSTVVVLFATNEAVEILLKKAEVVGVVGVTWIITDGSSLTEWISRISPNITHGSLTFTQFAGQYTFFDNNYWLFTKKIKDAWLQEFLLQQNITGQEELSEIFRSVKHVGAFVRNAVFAYAHALRNYSVDYSHFNSSLFFDSYLTQVKFKDLLPDADFQFDSYGNVDHAAFSIVNVVKNTGIRYIGEWTSDNGIQMSEEPNWVNGKPPKSICSEACGPGFFPVFNSRRCCWICLSCLPGYAKREYGNHECEPCPQGISNENKTLCLSYQMLRVEDSDMFKYVLVPSSAVTAVFSFIGIFIWIKMRNHPLVKFSNFTATLFQLTMHFLLASCIFIMAKIELTDLMCFLRTLIPVSFFVAILALMTVRAESLIKAFGSKRRISSHEALLTKSLSFIFVFAAVAINLTLGVLYMILKHTIGVSIHVNKKALTKERYCPVMHLYIFQSVYIFLMTLVCSFRLFRSRHLPKKFNEANYILLCCLCTLLSHTIIFFLVVTGDQSPNERFIFTATMLSLVNGFILVVMFGERTYIILFRKKKFSQREFHAAMFSAVKKNARKNLSLRSLRTLSETET